MFNLLGFNNEDKVSVKNSKSNLFDEKSFYSQFFMDLKGAQSEVIIESPFITSIRTNKFIPVFEDLLAKNIKIYIFTRDPMDHPETMSYQAEKEIHNFEILGIHVFICSGNFHRKLAMIDRKTLWEGSLNILSQNMSREIMRRFNDEYTTLEMFEFLKLKRFI